MAQPSNPPPVFSDDPRAPRGPTAFPQPNVRFPEDAEATRPGAQSSSDVWHNLRALVAELRESASYLLSTKVDGLKLVVRRVVMLAVLGVLGLLAGATFIVAASVMVLRGIAEALNVVMRSIWAGDLIVGVAVLCILGIGAWLGMRWMAGAGRQATLLKYRHRKSKQRTQFGRDVEGHSDAS